MDANSKRTLKILLIEDDTFLSELLKYKLTSEGFEVTIATNQHESRHALGAQVVDLILLDILLPDMNGFDFLEELKKNPAYLEIPVIIISNLGQGKDVERGLELGANEYILKAQVSPSQIVERVRAHIAKKQNAPLP